MNIAELIEKHKGERTFYDGELIGAYITVQNLENLCNEWLKEKIGEPVATTFEKGITFYTAFYEPTKLYAVNTNQGE